MLMPGTLTINSSPDFRYVNSFDACSSVPSFNASKALSPVNTFFVILSLLIDNIIGLAGQHIARSNARTDRYFVFLVPTLLPAGEALLPRLLIRLFRNNLDSSLFRFPFVIHSLDIRERSEEHTSELQ